ncbi:MAG: phosphatase PAP2 family protein [Chloroflexota bacterium]|nr:phosphatase PAP2 family protein [Chloroflexota bacterium]
MSHNVRSNRINRRIPKVVTVLVMLFSFSMLSSVIAVSAQDDPQIEPLAGTWTTWVLDSGSQFRLDAPPDDAATATEIAQLIEMVADRDEAGLIQIDYWNTGAPAYRWNQIAMEEMLQRALPGNISFRHLALIHVAIYDATVAAWDSKYTYNRPRPSEVDPSLETVIPNPSNPSYPSDYAVTAGAAAAVLAAIFPEEAAFFEEQAQEAVHSRLLAGVEYPNDVEAGLELGRQVAELVIARGAADGSNVAWTDSIPTEAHLWTGENPAFAAAGTWQPWVMTSGDQFRPPPPPAYDSEQTAAEMEELRAFERTPVTNASAMFWEFGAGGRRIHWFWNDQASRLILGAGWGDNAPMTARAYALANIAGLEGMIACFDAKYTYWSMRPFQLDPEFTPLFTTPNHPSYPSAHSCISGSVAGVLAHLFPSDAEAMFALANEASEARIAGGIHLRSDIVSGLQIGEDVANAVIAHE